MNNNYVSKAGSWERDSNTQFGGSCVLSWITALPSHQVDQADESNYQDGMLKRHRCLFRATRNTSWLLLLLLQLAGVRIF